MLWRPVFGRRFFWPEAFLSRGFLGTSQILQSSWTAFGPLFRNGFGFLAIGGAILFFNWNGNGLAR